MCPQHTHLAHPCASGVPVSWQLESSILCKEQSWNPLLPKGPEARDCCGSMQEGMRNVWQGGPHRDNPELLGGRCLAAGNEGICCVFCCMLTTELQAGCTEGSPVAKDFDVHPHVYLWLLELFCSLISPTLFLHGTLDLSLALGAAQQRFLEA